LQALPLNRSDDAPSPIRDREAPALKPQSRPHCLQALPLNRSDDAPYPIGLANISGTSVVFRGSQ